MSGAGDAAVAALERRLGHHFSDRSLLETALTHASAAEPGGDTYQRLEFLGDRVLGLVISELLFDAFPGAAEGELSRRLAQLVRKETCAEVARALKLGSVMRMAGGKSQKAGGKTNNVLGDLCEAVIGALYLDGGLEVAERFIRRYWEPKLSLNLKPPRDSKTVLQEWAQAGGLGLPSYDLLKRKGPDHAPTFEVEVAVEGRKPAKGIGSSKRAAEQAAAETLLKREGLTSDE